jgi:hypothetical protein
MGLILDQGLVQADNEIDLDRLATSAFNDSVITKNVPPNTLVGGNPAGVIRSIAN